MGRSNNQSSAFRHTIVHAGVYLQTSAKHVYEWKHANWTNGFRCGAYGMPPQSFYLSMGVNISQFAFPTLFASLQNERHYQQPYAYLCYARDRSCKATAGDRDATHFEEMM